MRVFLFDLYETLLVGENFEERDAYLVDRITRSLKEHGHELSRASVDIAYQDMFAHFRTVESTPPHRAHRPYAQIEWLLRRLGVEDPRKECARSIHPYYGTVVKKSEMSLVKGAIPVLKKLKSLGMKLGLICNTFHSTGTALRELMQDLGVSEHMDQMLFSEEYGLSKPNPRIFEHALYLLGGEPPSETIFIGDNRTNDIEGATKAGLHAYHFVYTDENLSQVVDHLVDRLGHGEK